MSHFVIIYTHSGGMAWQ